MCILCDTAYYLSCLHPEDERKQTILEEWVNVATHALGIVWIVFQTRAFLRLAKARHSSSSIHLAISIFSFVSLVLYTNSTIYHLANIVLVDWIPLRYVLQRMDHVTIYIMIAGCYSCFILCVLFDKGWRKTGWLVLTTTLLMGLTGFVVTVFFPPSTNVDIYLYLAMGFSCMVYSPGCLYFCSLTLIMWLLAGGITYGLGTYFLAWDTLVSAPPLTPSSSTTASGTCSSSSETTSTASPS